VEFVVQAPPQLDLPEGHTQLSQDHMPSEGEPQAPPLSLTMQPHPATSWVPPVQISWARTFAPAKKKDARMTVIKNEKK